MASTDPVAQSVRPSASRRFRGVGSGLGLLMAAGSLGMAAAPAAGQCQLQQLVPADPGAGDQFGDAVAVCGQWMIIGASRDDVPLDSAGSAYVFRFDGIGWIQYAKLVAPTPAANDLFGWSVDIDEDSVTGEVTAVVGAYLHDAGGLENVGAVYVYRLQGDTWSFREKLLAPDPLAGDQLGQAVAIDEDWIVAGALRADSGGFTDAGAAHVWRKTGDGWAHAARLEHPQPQAQDRFGVSVAIDGVGTPSAGPAIIVGAALDDVPGLSNAGSATVFRWWDHDGDGVDSWALEQLLTDPSPGGGDNFGQAVAIAGDVAVVGSWLDDNGQSNRGSALVFRDLNATEDPWAFEARLLPLPENADDQFGRAVAISEDGGSVVVGAVGYDDGNQVNVGAAWLFIDDGAFWQGADARLEPLDGQANDGFGNAVALTEDVVLVGARNSDGVGGGASAGSVYTFRRAFESCEDCDGDFVADFLQIQADPSLDCDGDGVLDACQIDEDTVVPGDPDAGPFFCETGCDPDCNVNGIPDSCDIAAGGSSDLDGNGVPDECEDCNGNGTPDSIDILDGVSRDCNANGIPDSCDILIFGTELDCNADGIPDACQIADGSVGDCNDDQIPDDCQDCDGDGVADECEIAANPLLDLNGDGILDACQDCNGNLIPDFVEIAIGQNQNPPVILDCNGNGIIDDCEIEIDSSAPGGPFYCEDGCDPDCNGNGIPDSCDIASGFSQDIDGNGIPDACEDCNGNGTPDSVDAGTTSPDCDGDGVPDECQIAFGSSAPGGPFFCQSGCDPDCNGNGVPDACDIAEGTSEDCDGNGIPDECDPDCNGNQRPDGCDIADGLSVDFDGNGVPDECDPDCDGDGIIDVLAILFGIAQDCNGNAVPDACEIAGGDAQDADGDGIPDECQSITGDVDGDGLVDFTDLLLVLGGFGSCPPAPCPEDVDGDGVVSFSDVLLVLANFG